MRRAGAGARSDARWTCRCPHSPRPCSCATRRSRSPRCERWRSTCRQRPSPAASPRRGWPGGCSPSTAVASRSSSMSATTRRPRANSPPGCARRPSRDARTRSTPRWPTRTRPPWWLRSTAWSTPGGWADRWAQACEGCRSTCWRSGWPDAPLASRARGPIPPRRCPPRCRRPLQATACWCSGRSMRRRKRRGCCVARVQKPARRAAYNSRAPPLLPNPMDAGLKQRLIGAAVLVALAVIFLPMLVKGPAPDSGVSDLSMRVPDAPESGYRTVDLPLVVPAGAPGGGVLGTPEPLDDGQLATVDTATAQPPGERPGADALPADDIVQTHPDAAELAEDAATPAPAPAAAATPVEPPARTEPAPASAQPAAQPLPPTSAGGDYAVHFGAFGSERDAQLIVRQLSQAGLKAYSEPFTLDGRAAQRVRLGPFATREAAEAT